jgi:hypothetical protein
MAPIRIQSLRSLCGRSGSLRMGFLFFDFPHAQTRAGNARSTLYFRRSEISINVSLTVDSTAAGFFA